MADYILDKNGNLIPAPLQLEKPYIPSQTERMQAALTALSRDSTSAIAKSAAAQPTSAFREHLATGQQSSNIEDRRGQTYTGIATPLQGVAHFATADLDPRVIDTIIAEAGNDRAGQRAVAAAIINRAKAQGKTPLQIVQQHGQFEGYSNPGKASVAAQKMPSVRANAERAFTQIATGTVPDPLNGGTDFRASSATGGLHAPHGTVTIGGNTFALGRAPSTGLEAIQAVAPVPHPSLPAQTTAYANLPATTPPPLPIPRPSNPAGIRSVEINPDGSLKAPDLRTASLQPFAAGLGVQPQGAGDFWGPDTGRWGPSSFANAFPAPAVPERAPSAPLVSRNVHTVAIDPLTGNPAKSYDSIGAGPESWFPSVAAPTPPSPRQIAYNSVAGNVALPHGVVPASVTRDLAAIKGMQMNRSGSPDDRSLPPPIPTAPVPMPSRPSSLNTPYIPGPSSAPKDASSLPPGLTDTMAYGPSVPVSQNGPIQAITRQILNPAYTAALKAGQAYTAGGSIVTQAQQNAFGGFAPNTNIAHAPAAPLPPKYISVRVRSVPVPQPTVPLPIPRPNPPAAPHRNTGLLGLLFPGFSGNTAPGLGSTAMAPGAPPAASTNSNDYMHSDAPIGLLARQAGAGAQLPNSVVSSHLWQTGYR